MENMICCDCVLKHLAGALSYGKQIISGHSMGADLDHRIDFLGEIKNAEDHLQLMNQKLYQEISAFRKDLQSKKVIVDANDLEFIRSLYKKVEQLENGIETTDSSYDVLDFDPNIVFMQVNNKEYFDLAYNSVKKHLKDYNKIQVLKTNLDLSEYADVEVLHENIKEYALSADDFILMYENNVFLKDFSARKIENSFSMKNYKIDAMPYLRKQGIEKSIYCYDNLKPCKIKTDIFNEAVKDYDGDYPITVYCYIGNQTTALNDNFCTVVVDRNICCSTKTALKTKYFARFTENGFQSLKKWLD